MTGYLRTFCGGDGYAFDAAHAHRSALEFDAVVVAGPEEGDWSVMDHEQAIDCGFIEADEPSDSTLDAWDADARHLMAVTATGVR